MGFPTTHNAIRRMFLDVALTDPNPSSVARKALLESGVGRARPRTVAEGFVDALFPASCWQWVVDLRLFSRVRLDAHGAAGVYVWYSLAGVGTTNLDPGDYAPLGLSKSQSGSEVGDALGWVTLSSEQRAPMRLSVASSSLSWELDPTLHPTPFSIAIQAD